MILKWLKGDIESYFKESPENKVVLFFDPHGEYRNLIDHLEGEFNVLRDDQGLLKIKYTIEYSKQNEKFVIYLPFSKDSKEISYLKEYVFTGMTFSETLYMYLKKKGVMFPSDLKEIAEIKKTLPSLALESIGKGEEFWKKKFFRPKKEIYFSNFDELVLEIIDDPENIFERQKNENKLEEFLEAIESEYGYKGELDDPKEFRLRFFTQLCFTELFVLSGQPKDFPFRELLPQTDRFEASIKLVENLRNHQKYKEVYKKLTFKIEEKYDIRGFAKSHAMNPEIETFMAMDRAAISEIKKQVERVGSKKEFRKAVIENKNFIEKKHQGFWSREGEIIIWDVLLKICQLVEEINRFYSEFPEIKGIKNIVDSYCHEYYIVDYFYREYLAYPYEAGEDLEYFPSWIEKLYIDFLDKLNSKYTEEIFKKREWGIENISYQGNFWKELKLKDNIAIFFVDALRYELGKELENRLSKEYKILIGAMYSQIPTITSIGMSFLLSPKNPELRCDPSGLMIESEGKDLSSKYNRIEYLKSRYKNLEIFKLSEFNKLHSKEIRSKKDPIIIFTKDFDDLGETGGINFLKLFSQIMADIVGAVRKLMKNGYPEVHVVTDHGFLSFDDPKANFKIGEKPGFLKDSRRFACGDHLGGTNLISLEIPYLKDKTFYFPRGIYYFRKDSFLHGGISIHETIIPYLVIKPEEGLPEQFDIKLKMEGNIFNKIFEVKIRPILDSFDKKPRTVEVMVYHDNTIISNRPTVTIDMDERSVMLRLITDKEIPKGTKVKIKVIDQETKEILDEAEKEVMVEFEKYDF